MLTESDLAEALAPIRADQRLLKWMLGLVVAGIIALLMKMFFL